MWIREMTQRKKIYKFPTAVGVNPRCNDHHTRTPQLTHQNLKHSPRDRNNNNREPYVPFTVLKQERKTTISMTESMKRKLVFASQRTNSNESKQKKNGEGKGGRWEGVFQTRPMEEEGERKGSTTQRMPFLFFFLRKLQNKKAKAHGLGCSPSSSKRLTLENQKFPSTKIKPYYFPPNWASNDDTRNKKSKKKKNKT